MGGAQDINIVIVGQRGRLAYEAVLFAASLRANDPGFAGRLFVAEPQPGPNWTYDPRIQSNAIRELLAELGAEFLPFDNHHFGESYPNGNKAEALPSLPESEPFLYFDTDTIITGPLSKVSFDPARPAASMLREATWPVLELYGPGYSEIWKSLYDRFGIDFETSLDPAHPEEYWRRYLYFSASWFFGPCPGAFGKRLVEVMAAIRSDPPPELVCQSLDPWLDQVALPLVIHEFGGGRPDPELRAALDGGVAQHWRVLPLFYARAPDPAIEALERVAAPNKIKKVLKEYEPFRRMIFQKRGHKARALFDRDALPRREQAIRNKLRANKLWLR